MDILSLKDEVVSWRRDLHRNPGIAFEETFANQLIVKKLTEWGIPFVPMAKTGIVAIIEGKQNSSGRTIGLRADIDALPMNEEKNKPWASQIPDRMHGCGHDGHTAILLGTAKYLNATRDFDGRVLLIFQPAEEDIGGARVMVEEGLFTENLKCDEIYAIHNWPTLPIGMAATGYGPIMASADDFRITVRGKGGHVAEPEQHVDPAEPAAQMLIAANAMGRIYIAAKDADQRAWVKAANMNSGTGATNVITDEASISGTIRTFSEAVRANIKNDLKIACESIAAQFNVTARVEYTWQADVTATEKSCTDKAIRVMEGILGSGKVCLQDKPDMGAEDFGTMLQKVPGNYLVIGQATGNPQSPHDQHLHTGGFDFNDDIIPTGMEYLVRMVQETLPRSQARPSAPFMS